MTLRHIRPAGHGPDRRAIDGTIVVIAKEPVPGRAKTRLTPPCTPGEAATLAAAALADTLDAVRSTPVARRVLVLDGSPGWWCPPGFEVVPQVGGGLDLRLEAAITVAAGPTLLVGMDTPQVTPALLTGALSPLVGRRSSCTAVLGQAVDGGWWAVGFARRPRPGVFAGVPMSTAGTGAAQRRRLVELGHDVVDLPVLRDVDHVADLEPVAATMAGGRFPAAVGALAAAIHA